MNCAYFQMTRASMVAVATGQMNFFDASEQVLYVPAREGRACTHKSTRLRKLGSAWVALCKCHHTKMKSQRRYARKRISQRSLKTRTRPSTHADKSTSASSKERTGSAFPLSGDSVARDLAPSV